MEPAAGSLQRYHKDHGHVDWGAITKEEAKLWFKAYKTGESLARVSEAFGLPVSGLHRLFLRLFPEEYRESLIARRRPPKWMVEKRAFRHRVAAYLSGGYLVSFPVITVPGLDLLATPRLSGRNSLPVDCPVGVYCSVSGVIDPEKAKRFRIACRAIGASESVATILNGRVSIRLLDSQLGLL